jgi:hypothetical protein
MRTHCRSAPLMWRSGHSTCKCPPGLPLTLVHLTADSSADWHTHPHIHPRSPAVLRVLTERDMENSATLTHQKRKLTKLKDALSALAQRHAETEARDRKRNEELTEEYRRITQHYRDLQVCIFFSSL